MSKYNFTEEQEKEIIEFYLEPNTLKNAANRFNLSVSVIKRILKKYNILLHSKEIITSFKFNGKRANQLISKEKEKNIINFYLIPNTLKDTANKFNTCSQTVKAILIKNNITLHSKEINIQLRQQKEIESNLQKYGVENTFQRSDIKEKIKQTNLQNYGVDNISKANYIKEKKKQTFNKKYGVDNCSQLDTIKKKKEKTCMEHFGVPCYLQTDDCRENMKKLSLEKYGTEYMAQADEIKNKSKLTNLKKYGVPCYLQTDECKEKLKQINFEKYGMYHTPKLLYKYENQYFDSFPELCLYIYYIKSSTKIIREPVKLVFIFENKQYYYYPDFEVNGQLIEIKGKQFLKEDGTWCNPYDHSLDKLFEAKHQCALANNVKILYKDEYQKYIDWFNNQGYKKEDFIVL